MKMSWPFHLKILFYFDFNSIIESSYFNLIELLRVSFYFPQDSKMIGRSEIKKVTKKELVAIATPLKIISVSLNDFKLALLKQNIVSGAPLQ